MIAMTCTLADFKLPEPDVRLVLLNKTVYKIKLRYRGENQGVGSYSYQRFALISILFLNFIEV